MGKIQIKQVDGLRQIINNGGIGGTSSVQIFAKEDKFMVSLLTTTDGELATLDTISNTPIDGCYVQLYVNGEEEQVGDGVTTAAAYFSSDNGNTAKGFDSTHINGQIQVGDSLYWNGSVAGYELNAGWRISLNYIIYK